MISREKFQTLLIELIVYEGFSGPYQILDSQMKDGGIIYKTSSAFGIV